MNSNSKNKFNEDDVFENLKQTFENTVEYSVETGGGKIIPPDISPETMKSMWEFFLKTSVPRLIEKKRLEEAEKERQALDNNQDEGKRGPMRRIRGVKALVKYLETVDCPMSESTIYKLLREKHIPAIRPSDRILLFDLDAIDRWLTVDENENSSY